MNEESPTTSEEDQSRTLSIAFSVAAGLMTWALLIHIFAGKIPESHEWFGAFGRLAGIMPGQRGIDFAEVITDIARVLSMLYGVALYALPFLVPRMLRSKGLFIGVACSAIGVAMSLVADRVFGQARVGYVLLILPVALSLMALQAIATMRSGGQGWLTKQKSRLLRSGWAARLVLGIAGTLAMAAHFVPLVSYEPAAALTSWRVYRPMDRDSGLEGAAWIWRGITCVVLWFYAAMVLIAPWLRALWGIRRLWIMRIFATVVGINVFGLLQPFSAESHHWALMNIALFGFIWLTALPWSNRLELHLIQIFLAVLIAHYLLQFIALYIWGKATFFIAVSVWLEVLGLFLMPSGRVGKKG
jgi:hypothetical protein